MTGGTARPEAQRLPPGQLGVKTWPVLDLGVFQSCGTYTTNLPLAEFAVPDALLAIHRKGEPLSVEHGGPLRVVVPQPSQPRRSLGR